jgi:hypothetical protein
VFLIHLSLNSHLGYGYDHTDPDPHQKKILLFFAFLSTSSPWFFFSVADPGCLSRIPDPDFYPSRILDPTTATKERGEKKFVVIPLLYPQISHNCKLFYFWNTEEKNLGQFSKNFRTFPKNLSLSSQIYGFGIRDPRSGKNLFRIPDPGLGVKKSPDPGSSTLVFLQVATRLPGQMRQ